MPRCSICNKKFARLSDLEAHHRAVHSNTRFSAPSTRGTRNILVVLIIVVVAAGGFVGYLILGTQASPTPVTTQTEILGKSISSSIYSNLASVTDSALSVGAVQGVSKPTAISGSPLSSGNKVVVLYVGAEFCPYCAAETWPLVISLSRFGTFSNLEYMLSSPSDSPANVPTFSFRNSQYASQYVTFVSVEQKDRSGQDLQQITENESSLMQKYDTCSPSCSIPFIDIGNKYAMVGAQYPPSILVGQNWTTISEMMANNSGTSISKSILSSASYLISAICSADGGVPSSVCSSSYAHLTAWQTSPAGSSLIILQYSTVRRTS